MPKRIFRLALALLFILSFSRLPASAQNYVYQSSILGNATPSGTPANFNAAYNTVVDGQGNIYILSNDDFTHIRKYDRAGHFLGYFAEGQLHIAYYMTIDSAGYIVVGDDGDPAAIGPTAKRFDTAGRLVSEVVHNNEFDNALLGKDGNYYFYGIDVTMPYYHGPASYYFHIYRYSPNGTLTLHYPSLFLGTLQWNGGYPGGIDAFLKAVDSKGNGFISGDVGHGITKVDNMGNITAQLTNLSYNLCLIDNQDRLYIEDPATTSIQVYDNNGVFLYQFSAIVPNAAGGSNDNGGLFLDGRGNLYITPGSRIDIFAPSTNVVGTVALDGVALQSGAALPSVTAQFRARGSTTALFTRTLTLTPDSPVAGKGAFTIPNVPLGTYDIAFKTPKNLQTTVKDVAVSGVGYGPDVFLRGGDANNDNTVDAADFGILVEAYNSNAGVPGSGYDAAADFNDDGMVDALDYGLLVSNYNTVGDP